LLAEDFQAEVGGRADIAFDPECFAIAKRLKDLELENPGPAGVFFCALKGDNRWEKIQD
jgi:hypothetical protein